MNLWRLSGYKVRCQRARVCNPSMRAKRTFYWSKSKRARSTYTIPKNIDYGPSLLKIVIFVDYYKLWFFSLLQGLKLGLNNFLIFTVSRMSTLGLVKCPKCPLHWNGVGDQNWVRLGRRSYWMPQSLTPCFDYWSINHPSTKIFGALRSARLHKLYLNPHKSFIKN